MLFSAWAAGLSRQFPPHRALYNPGQIIPKRRDCIGEMRNARADLLQVLCLPL
jgi:hypothetical protein